MANRAAAQEKVSIGGGSGFSVADAKARFSEVLSTVEKRRQAVTIFRRGIPIAQIIPMQEQSSTLYGSMRGTVVETGDIVGPTGGEWSVADE